MRFAPAVAVLITGLALYLSRGVLDQIGTGNDAVRVAMLPPWPAFGAFLAIGVLGLLWLDRRAVPRGTATAVRPPLGPLVLPLFGLVVLILPYLPVLADRMPVLQMLAGPLRGVVWLIVLMQLAWVLWQARLLRAEWVQRWSLRRVSVALALATLIVCGSAAATFTRTVLYPAGDEPHYLVIAQSLWRDGDLKIENNHTRGDYREYFRIALAPHYLTRGADSEIYSIHPIGMPVIMAPVYAAGGYRGVVAVIVIMAALAAALMWLATVSITNAVGAATFAWAAVVFTTPFLYNSFAVYPEIAAALAVVLAYTRAASVAASPGAVGAWLVVGAACAALPWLSTKYAPMSAALVVVALARIWFPHALTAARPAIATAAPGRSSTRRTDASRVVAATAVVVPYVASLAAWFGFFYAIWGIPLPQAPYGDLVQTDLKNLIFGAPGLLFDQEYGLLPYAPVYILAATGSWVMWRQGGDLRRRAFEIAVVFGALLGTVGAFRIWWGGSASPGRPLVSGLLLLALPIAVAFKTAPAGSARRAAHHVLLWISIGVAGILALAQEGFLISNGRDGTSSLLEYLSPRWPAWTVAPSFIYHEAPTALMHVGLWLAIAALAAVALSRARSHLPGVASATALGVISASLLAAAVVIPLVPVSPAWPTLDVQARARTPLLDDFDAAARPLAIEYAPLRWRHAADLPARAMLGVEPGQRTLPQPIRVIHNGRFSLPAGRYRLDVEWNGDRDDESLGLQAGRTGNAWLTWRVSPRTGQRWSTEFDAPVDLSFVGLRGSPALERATGRILLTPLAVVDATRRPKVPTVLAASRSGEASVFYFDVNASPEVLGFWVWGARKTRVAIARTDPAVPLTLRVHSGAITNRLHIATFGWAQSVTLQPKLPDVIEIPVGSRRLVVLELSTDLAFVPSQLDPAATDDRQLGAWIEVVK
ncbi:MAG TPA: hypothetical protein VNJ02_20305 [Vicinamibacterales bacterium]|nr:hypothetical protein [Vicinamibacterales bacterium]